MPVLPKTQRNQAVLVRTLFTTLWRSGIHTNVKIDSDAGVVFVSAVIFKYLLNIKQRVAMNLWNDFIASLSVYSQLTEWGHLQGIPSE
jgi:hypothetical protein